MNTFLNTYITKYAKRFIICCFLMLLLAIISNIPPYLLKLIVDIGIPHKQIKYVIMLAMICLGTYIVYAIGDFILSYIFTYVCENINLDIKKDVLRKIILYPMSFFNNKEKGYILARANETTAIKPLFSSNTCKLLLNILEFLVASVVMFTINTKFTLAIYCFLPIYYVVVKTLMKKVTLVIGKNMEENAKANGTIQQILTGIEEVKISNKEKIESSRVDRINETITKLQIKQGILMNLVSEMMILLSNILTILVLCFFSLYIIKGTMTMGDYLAFSGYLPKLLAPIQMLVASLAGIQPAWKALKRVIQYFSDGVDEEEDLLEFPILEGEIKFESLSFKYPHCSEYVFKDFNLLIPKFNRALICGKNGTGKTTLLKLILGLYTEYSGYITIDGKDIRKYKKASLRSQISIVSQTVFLFSGTIKENILYSVSHYSDEDIERALEISGLLEAFSNGTSLSLQSNVGENGILLSGGQRQMIAVARAIMRKSKIWIFDEATSNLDIGKSKKLYQTVNEYFTGVTCIIVSHDLIEEIKFDKIVNLDKKEGDTK